MIKQNIMLIIVLICMISCDIIVVPERVISHDAVPPNIKELNFNDLYYGKHIDGRLEIKANVDDVEFDVSTVSIMVDEEIIHSVSPNGYLTLDTREFDEGKHSISVLVYSSNRQHGMLNLLHTPSLYLQTEVIFDRTPPFKVEIYGEMTNSNLALISWEKSPNKNFYAYKILRGRIGVSTAPNELLGIIYERDSLNFSDKTLREIYGMGYEYQVQVATDQNFEYVSYSEEMNLYYGAHNRLEDIELFSTPKILTNNTLNEYYMLGTRELVAFDMISHDVTKMIELPNLADERNFTKSNDGSILYVLDANNNTIDVIKSQNFSLLSHQNILNEYSETPRINELIYMSNSKLLILNNEVLYYYDTKSATIINKLELNIYEHSIKIEKINSEKIVISSNYDDGYKLRIRNIVSAGMPVVKEHATSSNYFFMYADTTEQKLYGHYVDDKLRVHSLTTLELLETKVIHNLLNFFLEDKYLYTSQHEYIDMYGFADEGARVICWDKSSSIQIKSYLTYGCRLSNDYCYSNDSNLVVFSNQNSQFPIINIKK